MISEEEKTLIIIPDVHGLPFWESPSETYRQANFVFLGDYLDPYPEDMVKDREAFDGLVDIVDFKRKNTDRVTLLLGNHDLHYLSDVLSRGSRFDEENEERNRRFFNQNRDCFQIAYETLIKGRRYLFTHAGVGRMWIKDYSSLDDEDITADWLNRCMASSDFYDALNQVSTKRGGTNQFGSMIWADATEQLVTANVMMGITQVFGHTFLRSLMNLQNRIYCLDCARVFYVNLEDGLVYDLANDELVLESF